MAWEARSGLKPDSQSTHIELNRRLNGLGSPFGFETIKLAMLRQRSQGPNCLGSPFGFNSILFRSKIFSYFKVICCGDPVRVEIRSFPIRPSLNLCVYMLWEPRAGLTQIFVERLMSHSKAKWPGKPVRV